MTISLVGTATGTNTCSVPAHAIGDIIVIFAFRATTGAPALPAGYTSILTKSGTSCSCRIGFKIATTTSDAAGTWTNAISLTCHVYRSSQHATGGSVFAGASAASAQTTNTINYPALTMLHGDNTSWVAGFAGVNNTTNTLSAHPPSGMTNESTVTNAASQAAGFDTEGTVSSWSSTNATTTGTPGDSVSATVEIIENQPGVASSNFVQHWSMPYQLITDDPNPQEQFTYNIDPTLAGNGLVVVVAYPSGATPSITDNQSNSWPASGTAGSTVTADNGAGNMALQAFILTSATTGTSQIVVSFGGNPQIPVKVWITQLYNITGTLNGSANAAGVNAIGIVSPGSFTPTNNDANGGNLVLAYMVDASQLSTTNPALIVPESNYALNDADIANTANSGSPNASQFYLQATAAATTPRFYLNAGGTETYNVIALALSLGTQGTPAPSGAGTAPHIDRVCFFGNALFAGGNWLLQIPSTGNCGVLMSFLNGDGVQTSASATDSDGTSWTKVTNAVGAQTPYYNANQTPKSNRNVSVSVTGSGPLQLVYYDISNTATSPLVTSAAGTLATTNNTNSVANQPSITPTAANQLTIASYINTFGPTPAVTSPSGATYDSPYAFVAKFVGTIAATTLTVSSTTWGAVTSNGAVISGTGVALGTTVQSGAGASWTIQPSQTVAVGETMLETDYDSNTLNFGSAFSHFFNGSSTSAQNWTWSLANGPSTQGQGNALILAGPSAAQQIVSGWEVPPYQPNHPRTERFGALVRGNEGIEAPLINWFNAGWEVLPYQPPHPRPERAGALMRGDDGIQRTKINWYPTGWEIIPFQPPHASPEKRAAGFFKGDDGTEAKFINWKNTGWEVQLFQPPFDWSPLRSGIQNIGDIGIEAVYVYVPLQQIVYGWEIAPYQPAHPRLERFGALVGGNDGIEAPLINWFNVGWEVLPYQPSHPRLERFGALIRGNDGIEAPFFNWLNYGWEVPPFQPSHPRSERTGAVTWGDEGIESPLINWYDSGWEVQSVQPHYNNSPARSAIQNIGDLGIEAVYVYVPLVQIVSGWEIAPYQPQHPRPELFGALARGDDGIQSPFVNWFNIGWEIQPPQPNHPRPENAGAIMLGLQGIEAPYVYVPLVTITWGFEEPYVYPAKRYALGGAIAPHDDGVELPLINWQNTGWEIQPLQPPHPHPEMKAGAVMIGDQGTQAALINWYNSGWEVQPPQPPHPRSERAGSIMMGDAGIEATYTYIPPIKLIAGEWLIRARRRGRR